MTAGRKVVKEFLANLGASHCKLYFDMTDPPGSSYTRQPARVTGDLCSRTRYATEGESAMRTTCSIGLYSFRLVLGCAACLLLLPLSACSQTTPSYLPPDT